MRPTGNQAETSLRAWGMGRTASSQMVSPPPTPRPCRNSADRRQDTYRLAHVDLSWTLQAFQLPFQEGKWEKRFAGDGQNISLEIKHGG